MRFLHEPQQIHEKPENHRFPGCNPKTPIAPVAPPLKPLLNRCREAQGRFNRSPNPQKPVSLAFDSHGPLRDRHHRRLGTMRVSLNSLPMTDHKQRTFLAMLK
jgi:hypothetical protein